MSTITISGLPITGTLQDAGNLVIETAGVTQRFTASTLKSYISAGSLSSITATTGSFTSLTSGTITTTSDVIIGGNLSVGGNEGNISATIITPNQPYITNLGNVTVYSLIANANITIGNNLSINNNV